MLSKQDFDMHFDFLAECHKWKISSATQTLIYRECQKLDRQSFEDMCRISSTISDYFTPAMFLSECKQLRLSLAGAGQVYKSLPPAKQEESLHCEEALKFIKFMRAKQEWARHGKKENLGEICTRCFAEDLTDDDLAILNGSNPVAAFAADWGGPAKDLKEEDTVWVKQEVPQIF